MYMGAVIGKDREHLNEIEQKTGATLKVYKKGSNSSLCIKGYIESQKRAIREVKETVVRPKASLLFWENISNNHQTFLVKLYSSEFFWELYVNWLERFVSGLD